MPALPAAPTQAPAMSLSAEEPQRSGERPETLEHLSVLAEMGLLAAGVAHELTNPLSYLKANSEYLQARVQDFLAAAEAGDADKVRVLMKGVSELLDENLGGVRRMMDITAELRRVARPSGEPGACDVEDALERALLLTRNVLKYKATVILDLGHPADVDCDEVRLTQVLTNLLANAAQAIAVRGVVRVRTTEADGQAVIEVEDDGCGIPEDLLPRLFSPFVTTKPPGVGTGLGLWFARRTVEGLGGTIAIRSEVGKGTTLTVRIQVATPPRGADAR